MEIGIKDGEKEIRIISLTWESLKLLKKMSYHRKLLSQKALKDKSH